MRLVPDQSDNHAVEVKEEHDQVEAELGEGLFLVHVKLAEYLCRIKEMGVVDDLLHVPADERQVDDQRQPVAVDKKQEGQEAMDGGLRDDIRVQSVTEVDRVNIVTFKIAIHYGEEDLEEQVYGVD